MVSITSSGGVPSSSVIIENWFTSMVTTLRGVEQSWAARRTILSRKEGLALEHLGENTSRAPNVDGNIVFLPREHDLRGAIISRRHVAGHLRILYSGKTKVTYLGCCAVSQRKAAREGSDSDLEITILIHKDVAWFLWYEHKSCERVMTEPILRAY